MLQVLYLSLYVIYTTLAYCSSIEFKKYEHKIFIHSGLIFLNTRYASCLSCVTAIMTYTTLTILDKILDKIKPKLIDFYQLQVHWIINVINKYICNFCFI